jgi:hypothetical protein
MDRANRRAERWKPGVSRATLLLFAGAMWLAIGILLDLMAYSWLRPAKDSIAVPMAALGFAAALIIHHFGFLRIVDRNLKRILPMQGRRCLFGFMPWKSYFLIAVMMLMGFGLRHSAVPKVYLAALYSAIGTALILSSCRYLRHLVRVMRKE